MTLKNNRAPLLCYFKLCASFHSHWYIQTGVTVRKRPIWVKIDDFFEPCDLEIWRMTFKNNRAPLLSIIKRYASFHHHMWIQTGVTVRKRLIWVKSDDCGLMWQVRISMLCQMSLTVPLCSPSGRKMPAITAVQGAVKKSSVALT